MNLYGDLRGAKAVWGSLVSANDRCSRPGSSSRSGSGGSSGGSGDGGGGGGGGVTAILPLRHYHPAALCALVACRRSRWVPVLPC